MAADRQIAPKWKAVGAFLNERGRRRWAAAEAQALGRGGIAAVSRVTGLSFNTVKAGMAELSQRGAARETLPPERSRRAGAGRPRAEDGHPELPAAIEKLVAPATRGDPTSPLRWTSKSTRELAEALAKQDFLVTDRTVARLLHEAGYSLQALRKTREGLADHPDRDAQFRYIQRRIRAQQRAGEPVISIDCKKKELVGDFANGGREWQPKGTPEPVRVHDFLDPAIGKALPYGVYDVLRNEGWVSVGIDHETAEFAASTVLRWWRQMGRAVYARATTLQIIADGGGSNGSRNRLWKLELQRVANATGLVVRVCHLPPGTSKWNKIEHRMFCHITQNWRGRPLLSHQVVVKLITSTRTGRGLRIHAALDRKSYPTGIEVSEEDLASVELTVDRFHGEWNYAVSPAMAKTTTFN